MEDALIKKRNRNLPQTLTLDHVSPATRLLERRRQMFEVQEALDAQKEEFARREDAFRRREEGLRKKDLELQESLIKFNKFLQENEAKRNRADKRAAEEARQKKQKANEIVKLQEQKEDLNTVSKTLAEDLNRNQKYETFLVQVQEHVAEDYPEINDLLNRYKTLKDANRDLTNKQQENDEKNEKVRQNYSQYTKERTNEILNFNNEIASLQKRLEVSELNAQKLQNDVDSRIRTNADKTLELGQILMAVDNLFQRCTSKKHGNILKHTDGRSKENAMKVYKSGDLVAKQAQSLRNLEVIAAYMIDFGQVVEGLTVGGKKETTAAPKIQ